MTLQASVVFATKDHTQIHHHSFTIPSESDQDESLAGPARVSPSFYPDSGQRGREAGLQGVIGGGGLSSGRPNLFHDIIVDRDLPWDPDPPLPPPQPP